MIYATGSSAVTRLAAGSTGQLLTTGAAPSWVYPPGYEYAYDEVTASVGSITGTTIGTATTVKTSTSATFDGVSAVYIEFWCPSVQITSANFRVKFELFEDSTDIGEFGLSTPAAAGVPMSPVVLRRRRTPSAGAHTYTVKAFVPDGGTGTVNAGAGGSAGTVVPAFVRIVKA